MVKQDSLHNDYNMEGIIRGEKGGTVTINSKYKNIDTCIQRRIYIINIINILDQEIHHVLPIMGTG